MKKLELFSEPGGEVDSREALELPREAIIVELERLEGNELREIRQRTVERVVPASAPSRGPIARSRRRRAYLRRSVRQVKADNRAPGRTERDEFVAQRRRREIYHRNSFEVR